MTPTQLPRRSFVSAALGSIGAAFAGLMGGKAKADGLEIVPTPKAHPLLVGPCEAEGRITSEMRRLAFALNDPATPPDRWLQCYAAQQALAWALSPEAALSPCKTIAEGRVRLAMSWHSDMAATETYLGLKPFGSMPIGR